jgi:hypothetical protein
MPISQSELSAVLMQARQFYKGGIKSGNKMYDLSRVPNLSAKHHRRNSNAIKSDSERERQQELAELENIPDREWGGWLYSRGFTAGNCPEMSAVSAHLASESFKQRVKALFMVAVNYPGDHVFVLLSVNGDQPTWEYIPNMGREAGSNFWVIDCWFNIACPAQDYFLKLWTTLDRWAEQGKYILARESEDGSTNKYDLRPDEDGQDKYRYNLLSGRLTYHRLS